MPSPWSNSPRLPPGPAKSQPELAPDSSSPRPGLPLAGPHFRTARGAQRVCGPAPKSRWNDLEKLDKDVGRAIFRMRGASEGEQTGGFREQNQKWGVQGQVGRGGEGCKKNGHP